MHADEHRWDGLTEKIIGCAYRVANELGCGFLEKVYENALAHEMRKPGLNVQQQFAFQVKYDGTVVGEYVADLLVERTILVELKSVKELDEVHAAQCINYLKATRLPVCQLLNFGKTRVQIRRFANFDSVTTE